MSTSWHTPPAAASEGGALAASLARQRQRTAAATAAASAKDAGGGRGAATALGRAAPPDPSVIKAAFAALKAKRDAEEFTARHARVAATRVAGALGRHCDQVLRKLSDTYEAVHITAAGGVFYSIVQKVGLMFHEPKSGGSVPWVQKKKKKLKTPRPLSSVVDGIMCGTCSDHFVLPAIFRFRALEIPARDCVSAARAGSAHTERSPAGVAAARLERSVARPSYVTLARDTAPVAGPSRAGPHLAHCRRRRVRQRALLPRAGGIFLDAAAVAAHSRFHRRGRRRVAADAGAAAGAAAAAAAARGAAGAPSAPPSPTLAQKPVGRQRPSAHRRVRLPGHGDAVHRAAAARCVCHALLSRVARRHRGGAAAFSHRRALCVAVERRQRAAPPPTPAVAHRHRGGATAHAPLPHVARRCRALRVAAVRGQRAAPQPSPAVGRRHRGGATAHAPLPRITRC